MIYLYIFFFLSKKWQTIKCCHSWSWCWFWWLIVCLQGHFNSDWPLWHVREKILCGTLDDVNVRDYLSVNERDFILLNWPQTHWGSFLTSYQFFNTIHLPSLFCSFSLYKPLVVGGCTMFFSFASVSFPIILETSMRCLIFTSWKICSNSGSPGDITKG